MTRATPVKERGPKAPDPEQNAAASGILIIDDHPVMRLGLSELINRQPDMRVVGEAGSPAEGCEQASQTSPDLASVDICMPGRSGLELVKDLLALKPDLKILVLTMYDDRHYAERMIRNGARGYIMKEAGGAAILEAIRQILRGQIYVSPRVSASLLERLANGPNRKSTSPIDVLTDREFEVFQLIGKGLSTQEIASQIGLSRKTVDVHRANIKRKLGAKNLNALILEASNWVASLDR